MADSLLPLAVHAAEEAGRLLMERFGGPAHGVGSKSTPTDPVSDADRDSEALILGLIAKERPDDGVLGEEGGGKESTSGVTWIVDPLDATVNFLYGIPHWCVSVAAADPDGTIIGVVHNPNLGEIFIAELGAGAQLNGRPIRVSGRSDPAASLVATGFSYDARARSEQAAIAARLLPIVRDIRRAGSAALDLATLAAGRIDGFYEAPLELWDKAAGILLVTEAGGVVSEIPAPLGLTPGVVAANPALHDELRKLVTSDEHRA
ncbi:MAG: inositol monophosphatase family protein [Actinomycetota bacterium]